MTGTLRALSAELRVLRPGWTRTNDLVLHKGSIRQLRHDFRIATAKRKTGINECGTVHDAEVPAFYATPSDLLLGNKRVRTFVIFKMKYPRSTPQAGEAIRLNFARRKRKIWPIRQDC